MDKDYLKQIWNSVWDEDLSELEIQRRYFAKLDQELKGEDRFHLKTVGRKIDELLMKIPFSDLLAKRVEVQKKNNSLIGLQNSRTEGDGTEWIIEKDEEGKLFKRAIGSEEKIYFKNK